MLYSDLPYVGFAMHRRATVKTHLYFKRLMIKQMIYVKKKKRVVTATLCGLCFGATVYHLWRHRNDLLHDNSPRSEEDLVKQVKWEVRSRVLARCSAKKIVNSARLDQKWSLQPLVSS
jgi:hypothetical protein